MIVKVRKLALAGLTSVSLLKRGSKVRIRSRSQSTLDCEIDIG